LGPPPPQVTPPLLSRPPQPNAPTWGRTTHLGLRESRRSIEHGSDPVSVVDHCMATGRFYVFPIQKIEMTGGVCALEQLQPRRRSNKTRWVYDKGECSCSQTKGESPMGGCSESQGTSRCVTSEQQCEGALVSSRLGSREGPQLKCLLNALSPTAGLSKGVLRHVLDIRLGGGTSSLVVSPELRNSRGVQGRPRSCQLRLGRLRWSLWINGRWLSLS
jgi:hypothetical protein